MTFTIVQKWLMEDLRDIPGMVIYTGWFINNGKYINWAILGSECGYLRQITYIKYRSLLRWRVINLKIWKLFFAQYYFIYFYHTWQIVMYFTQY